MSAWDIWTHFLGHMGKGKEAATTTPTTSSETSSEGKDVVRDAVRGIEHATAEVGAKIQHAGEDFVKMVDDAVHRTRDETMEAADANGDGDVNAADVKATGEKSASKCSMM